MKTIEKNQHVPALKAIVKVVSCMNFHQVLKTFH